MKFIIPFSHQIDEDFRAKWPEHANNFTTRWENIAKRLFPKLLQDVKDPDCCKVIAELQSDDNSLGESQTFYILA